MSDFIPNPRLFAELESSAEIKEVLHRKAEQAADEARRIAQAEAFDTGAYMNSIAAHENEVIAEVPYAVFIEFGSARNPRVATLRRSLDSLHD